MNPLNYSIVVATRNRVQALRLSLPRMLTQSRLPAQLIVVDSSDDHQAVIQAVQAAVLAASSPLRPIIVQAERGLTRQRNLGLALVEHPVVFFPDDDSIWLPGVAEAILAIYERDTAGVISAVCAYDSPMPPADFSAATAGYAMSFSDRVKRPLAQLRSKLERKFFPDPGVVLGKTLIAKSKLPDWLDAMCARPVEWMTGYRMTFRTEVIRRYSFDETLTRYCLFEDRDASYAAWRAGVVVAVSSARVFHYRSPEKRDAGHRLGIEQLLNLAYIIIKHTPPGHAARRCLLRFARYKVLLYKLGAHDDFSRERLEGARAALVELPLMISASSADSARLYQETMRRCMPSPPLS